MIKNNQLYKKLIIGAFLVVPILSSFISTVHVVTLFSLGNVLWMSIFLAVVFELGQLSSLLALAVLDKINKSLVWGIFILLALMQIIGNVYYTFDFVGLRLAEDPMWLSSALELANRFSFNEVSVDDAKFYVSLIIGVPIPLIAIAFLKSMVDYLRIHDGQIKTAVETATDNLQESVESTKDITETTEEKLKEPKQSKEKSEDSDDIDKDLEKISKGFVDKKYIESLWDNVNEGDNSTDKKSSKKK